MAKEDLISVCIPTRNRPGLLRQAMESCLAQSYRPLEIVIGDDSEDQETARLVATYQAFGVPIDYQQNAPPRGQAGNVNQLFRRARGSRLLLLHDDDLLLPDAVDQLAQCWNRDPAIAAAFGKQRLISHDGSSLSDEQLNSSYFRTSDFAGTRLSAIESALVQQFPNDGFLVSTETARRVGYRERAGDKVNRWSDFDFGIRLARAATRFYFLDEYTAVYRRTRHSVSQQMLPREICQSLCDSIAGLVLATDSEWARARALERVVPGLVEVYAAENDRAAIARLMLSSKYPAKFRRALMGMRHLALLVSPRFVGRVRRLGGV